MRLNRILQTLAVVALLGLLTGEANARRVYNTTRTSVNTNVHRDRDVNIDRDVDVHRDIDIDVDRDYHPVARAAGVAAATTMTAIAVGTVVRSLPPACSAVSVNNITYQNCGGTWYQPRYAGTDMTYVVVNPPR